MDRGPWTLKTRGMRALMVHGPRSVVACSPMSYQP